MNKTQTKSLEFTSKWFVFEGFENFPEFLMLEFNVPKEDWKITRTERDGTGLEVKDKEVTIWGNELINYATLLQLIKQSKVCLPEVRIEETLKFWFRGYHLDIARGGVPKVETFKKILRWLFLLKYNYFAIYFEDLFPWRKYPQIGEHKGKLTEDELREIIEYGKNLGIEVFPSLKLSAHMENILSVPEFQGFSEWWAPEEGCLNLSDQKAREFAYELLSEVVDLFPSKYVHIGGDETRSLGRGRSLNKVWMFEGPKLYELHHRNIIEIVKKGGKEPILLGGMISGMNPVFGDEGANWAELMESEIWKEVLVANWDYRVDYWVDYPNPKQHFKDKINKFKERGPGLSNWYRYYPNFKQAIANLQNLLTTAKEEDLPGFLICDWGAECFSFLEPLILASMEIAEGDGEWQEKWMAITGESEEILKARMLFGDPDVSGILKTGRERITREYKGGRVKPRKAGSHKESLDENLEGNWWYAFA